MNAVKNHFVPGDWDYEGTLIYDLLPVGRKIRGEKAFTSSEISSRLSIAALD
jgi:hypothetical protein